MPKRETLEKSDLDLIAEFKQGRQEAFSELVRRHMGRAIQLAHVALGGHYEDAKDVSQEAFVRAYRALDRFEGRSKFSTWFYRILMNEAQSFLRKKRWKFWVRWTTNESMTKFFETVEDPHASSSRGAERGELNHKIHETIGRLPFKQQWIFTLRFIEGLSIHEISEATGTAEGTVKANLFFAVKKFKEKMAPYLKEENA